MINPSSPKFQLLGVNNNENFEHYKNIYKTLDINFAIVNSTDGYDEVSLTADTHVATNKEERYIAPADFGMQKILPEKLFGGNSIEAAAKIFVDILSGKGTKEQNNVVVANAALSLNVVYSQKSLSDCVEMARESLESGEALQKLKAITKD